MSPPRSDVPHAGSGAAKLHLHHSRRPALTHHLAALRKRSHWRGSTSHGRVGSPLEEADRKLPRRLGSRLENLGWDAPVIEGLAPAQIGLAHGELFGCEGA